MITRRDALLTLGLSVGQAACAGVTPVSSSEAGPVARWARYPQTVAIDGAGGLALGFLTPDDPLVPAELAAARASGLSGVVLTLAPQGQFWMDEAARARVHANIETWDAIIARHPSHLLPVRTGADLTRARKTSLASSTHFKARSRWARMSIE